MLEFMLHRPVVLAAQVAVAEEVELQLVQQEVKVLAVAVVVADTLMQVQIMLVAQEPAV
jgi:hypothetical protein